MPYRAFSLICAFVLLATPCHAEREGRPREREDRSTLGLPLSPRGHLGEEENLPFAIGLVGKVGQKLIVISSLDGGKGSGAFGVISPFIPNSGVRFPTKNALSVLSPDSAETEREKSALKNLREAHGFGFSGSKGAFQSRKGVQLWDFASKVPQFLQEIVLPGIGSGDYDGAWWVAYQAPYLYVSAGSGGLYVVELPEPKEAPTRILNFEIERTGGFPLGSVYAIGNRLVVSGNRASGISLLDISRPYDPVLLTTITTPVLYSGLLHGSTYLGAGADKMLHSYSIDFLTDQITGPLFSVPIGAQGGYLTANHPYAYVGASKQLVVVNLEKQEAVGFASSNRSGRDEDFASVIGPLVVLGDDHNKGAFLFQHKPNDLVPPSPLIVLPTSESGALENEMRRVPASSPLGVGFSEPIDPVSVTETSVKLLRDGQTIVGARSASFGIVNFTPSEPLPVGNYLLVFSADGVKDYAGNGLAKEFQFAVHVSATPNRASCDLQLNSILPREGETVQLNFTTPSDPNPVSFRAFVGTDELVSDLPTIQWTPSDSGRVSLRGIARYADGSESKCARTILVIPKSTPRTGVRSQTLALDSIVAPTRAYVANDDNGTIVLIDLSTTQIVREVEVGGEPSSIAAGADGSVWVTLKEDDSLLRFPEASLVAPPSRLRLPYGSAPTGVVVSSGSAHAFVALSGRRSIVRVVATGEISGEVSFEGIPRSLTLTPDESKLLVPKFKSVVTDKGAIEGGIGSALYSIPLTAFDFNDSDEAAGLVSVVPLPQALGEDSESFSRGQTNYLFGATLSSSGALLAIPGKKDNIARGLYRDGRALTFESTVRASIALLNSTTGETIRLLDIDNRSLPTAVEFDPTDELLYVLTHGSNTLDTVRVANGERLASLENLGVGPLSLLRNEVGNQIFVHDPLSRQLIILSVAPTGVPEVTARVPTVLQETTPLSLQEGRRIFTQASNRRMSRDNYLSCATCHFEGDDDGITWDFTDRGEGLRNTLPLWGRRSLFAGRLHWSGNFDEMQDFEGDIRRFFGGSGFLPDLEFLASSASLGPRKGEGVSEALDNLSAYIRSLGDRRRSPFRSLLSAREKQRGRRLFREKKCASCHSGSLGTDSPSLARHNTGTAKESSGQRLGALLDGFDTPALTGLWDSEPYLHDGSAATLEEAVLRHRLRGRKISRIEAKHIARYLLTLE